jgi:hypothetical protein
MEEKNACTECPWEKEKCLGDFCYGQVRKHFKKILELEQQLQLKDKMIELMAKRIAHIHKTPDNEMKARVNDVVDNYKNDAQQALAELEE